MFIAHFILFIQRPPANDMVLPTFKVSLLTSQTVAEIFYGDCKTHQVDSQD